jgi:hypothetical protein
VTGALTALWPVSDKELPDWWVLLAAAGAKFHIGQRGLLRCVSFPRSGCRADVNSRQKWAIFLKQCHCPLALRQYNLSVSPSRVSSIGPRIYTTIHRLDSSKSQTGSVCAANGTFDG